MTEPALRLSSAAFAARAEPFVQAGLLDSADVYVVDRLAALASRSQPARGQDPLDADVLLGLAFAVRAPRSGHTGVDLATIATTATTQQTEVAPAAALAWPDAATWAARTIGGARAAGLIGPAGPFCCPETAPLIQTARLAGYERRLAAALAARAGLIDPALLDVAALQADMARLFVADARSARQRLAGALAAVNRTTVISGGPGTGKTTTVRAVLLMLRRQGATRVALAAPTGKAGARMKESLLGNMPDTVTVDEIAWLQGLEPSTIHRLLGWQPFSPSRYRHNREQPLPHDVVVIDESSMVDVANMCKLVEAVRPDARLILLGDRNQLASVEAGTVLADLTRLAGPTGVRIGDASADRVAAILGRGALDGLVDPSASALASGMVHYTHAFRFENPALGQPIEAIGEVSFAGDPVDGEARLKEAFAALTPSTPLVGVREGRVMGVTTFRPHPVRPQAAPVTDPAAARPRMVDPAVVAEIVAAFAGCLAPVRTSPTHPESQRASLLAIEALRVLCAHRRGSFGVSGMNHAIFEGLRGKPRAGATERLEEWVGRVVLVTTNDYEHDLWNGDVGIVVRDGGPAVAFLKEGVVRTVPLGAMPEHETAFAMTIHKSQGSQFQHVYVILPPEETPLLTRELVYTGISRAKASLTLCAMPDVLWAALNRRVTRASGLGELLG